MSLVFPQVRNLCYMVTRRERTKHAICKLQEQIFHLQMKLIEQDLCRGRRLPCPAPATSVCAPSRGWVPRRACLWNLAWGMCMGPGAAGPHPYPPSFRNWAGKSQGPGYVLSGKEPEIGMWAPGLPSGSILIH